MSKQNPFQFSIYKKLRKLHFVFFLAKKWNRLGLPTPLRMQKQIINELHTEMLVRILHLSSRQGGVNLDEIMKAHFQLGEEIAEQVGDFLSLKKEDARSLSKIVDYLHGLLNIKNKTTIVASSRECTEHWHGCSLADQLRGDQDGHRDCDIYQELYRGVLAVLHPGSSANDLLVTRSRGQSSCELITRIDTSNEFASATAHAE